MNYKRVEGHNDLVRDPNNGAILNININEFQKAKAIRAKRFQKEKEFDELKDEVSEIKIMLKQLLEKS
tara:strand:+ start:935 stop:1138 length:204 start_codon:yes stop_codon:yes gene_type:complete